jgi:sialidase-1
MSSSSSLALRRSLSRALTPLALLAASCSSESKNDNNVVVEQANPILDSTPFISGQGGYAVYRAPTIVRSQAGTLLAFAEGRVNGASDEDDMDIVLRRSPDGGKTWEPMRVLENDGKNPCKNQSPVVLPSGRIVLMWLWNAWIPSEQDRTTRKVFVTYSDDDGLTWSASKDVTAQAQKPTWGWTGLGPVHGIVKQHAPNKGRIVFPARHNTDDTNMVSHVNFSDDGGETWQVGGDSPRDKTTESTVVELSNGQLMLNSRNQRGSENHRVVSISKDGGATFSDVWLETQLVEPSGVQASLLFHSTNECTGQGNILFSNPSNPEVRADGTLRLSEDNGTRWTEALRYAPKPAPYFTGYSDIVTLPTGDIGVLYERGDADPSDPKHDRYKEIGFTLIGASSFKGLSNGADACK